MKLLGILVSLTLVMSACSASTPARTPDSDIPALDPAGWSSTVYQNLTSTIAGSAHQHKIAVFDWDNTTQARDIGEATLSQAELSKAINPAALSPDVFPPFTSAEGNPVSISHGAFPYYEALDSSAGDSDPFRVFSSMSVLGSAFYGHTIAEYVAHTAAAYDHGSAAKDLTSNVQSQILSVGRPFIYPQMADLYGNLRRHGYDVWIVSAGIGWAVRWMVQNALNPAIVAKYGADAALPLDHVVALTTLMKDRTTGKLVSDYQLTHQVPDTAYIDLSPSRISELEITAIPDGIPSWRGGKTGAIDDIISRDQLFLAAGDSDGDLEMLSRATNRLVIARLNKPALTELFAQEIAKSPNAQWLIQPVISTAPVGFLHSRCEMADKSAGYPELTAAINKAMTTLEATGRLGSFATC